MPYEVTVHRLLEQFWTLRCRAYPFGSCCCSFSLIHKALVVIIIIMIIIKTERLKLARSGKAGKFRISNWCVREGSKYSPFEIVAPREHEKLLLVITYFYLLFVDIYIYIYCPVVFWRDSLFVITILRIPYRLTHQLPMRKYVQTSADGVRHELPILPSSYTERWANQLSYWGSSTLRQEENAKTSQTTQTNIG